MKPKWPDVLKLIREQIKVHGSWDKLSAEDKYNEFIQRIHGPTLEGLVFGWWNYDLHEEKRIQVGTGRFLQYKGRIWADEELRISNSNNQHWMRFDYVDELGIYPLLVEWRCLPSASASRQLVWRLDHVRSAGLWKRETRSNHDYLPRERWHKIDRFAIDALATWPRRQAVILTPTVLAVSGGWVNDRWTPDFYRKMRIDGVNPGGTGPAKSYPFERKPAEPKQWQFMPASRIVPTEEVGAILAEMEAHGLTALERHLPTLVAALPHLRSADQSAFFVPLYTTSVSEPLHLTWLYLDQDFVSDQLFLSFRKSHNRRTEWSLHLRDASILGAFDRRRRTPIDEIPNELMESVAVLATDACWHWQASEVAFCLAWAYPNKEKPTKIIPGAHLNRPLRVTVPAPQLANHVFPLAGRQSYYDREIECLPPYQSYTTSPGESDIYFVEGGGYWQAEGQTPVFGRFDFDMKATALIDRMSGKCLSYVSTERQATDLHERPRHIFQYSGPDGTYPLVIDWSPLIPQGPYGTPDTPSIHVDHVASLALWRKTSSGGSAHPPRDFWAAMDEFIAQALVCWPELRVTGPSAKYCSRQGGWISGKWHEGAFRKLGLSRDHYVPGARLDEGPSFGGTHCPDIWEACNVNGPPVPHGERLDEAFATRFLNSGELPARMAAQALGDYPYFRRHDGKAIIFVCKMIEWGRQEGSRPSLAPVLQYCDRDIWLQFKGSRVPYPKLSFVSDPKLPKGSSFSSLEEVLVPDHSWYAPKALLWHRLASAFMGLFGLTPELKSINIEGGYIAGEWIPSASFRRCWKEE